MRDFPNQLYLPKQMGEDQLDDLELNGLITLKILNEIVWDFPSNGHRKFFLKVRSPQIRNRISIFLIRNCKFAIARLKA